MGRVSYVSILSISWFEDLFYYKMVRFCLFCLWFLIFATSRGLDELGWGLEYFGHFGLNTRNQRVHSRYMHCSNQNKELDTELSALLPLLACFFLSV